MSYREGSVVLKEGQTEWRLVTFPAPGGKIWAAQAYESGSPTGEYYCPAARTAKQCANSINSPARFFVGSMKLFQ